MSEARRVAVVGGGAIGLACARRLQQDGCRVRIYDPAPASSDSAAWGSAGIFAVDSVSPLATPEVRGQLPAMLLRGDSALALRWRHLPRLLPWLARFLWNTRSAAAEHSAGVLAALCEQALPAWHTLIDGRPAERFVRPGGWVTAFETAAGMRAARAGVERRRRQGVVAEWLDGAALRARVPELGGHVAGGVFYEQAEVCNDPAGLLEALAEDFAAEGGELVRARVLGIAPADDRVDLGTEERVEAFDRIVVAAGAHSRPIARTLGDDFPLETERGYHVMLESRSGPTLPVISGEHHFVTASMASGVRLAGTSELGGLQRPPDPARFALLRRQAAALFPGLDTGGGSEWMGFRPTLPDSLPIIGPCGRDRRVWYALGHQHLGLTLAGVTARLVADGLAGRTPPIDLQPLRVDRF